MTVASLVLQYIRALVWPVVVALAIVAFRHEARGLLRRLKSLGAPGFNAEFDSEVRNALETAKAAVAFEERDGERKSEEPPVNGTSPAAEYGTDDFLQRIIEIDPNSAVQTAWNLVERRLNEMVQSELRLIPPWRRTMDDLIRALAAKGLDPLVLSIAQSLYRLRNDAVHDPARVKNGAARNYVDTARLLIELIDNSDQRG